MRAALGLLCLVTACRTTGGATDTNGMTSEGPATSSTPVTSSTSQTPMASTTTAGTSSGVTGAEGVTSAATTSDDGGATTGPMHLYVTSGNAVYGWPVDAETGALGARTEVDVGQHIGPLAIDPARAHLYVATPNDRNVMAYAIDPSTGALSHLGTTTVGLRPVYLQVDATGSNLLITSFSDNNVAVHPIGGDGVVSPTPADARDVGARPHAILTDPANAHVFVPHRDENVVRQFAFDASSGVLTPSQPLDVQAPAGAGPRHMVFHPSASHAYVVNEFTDSVSTYAYDAATGQLTLRDTDSAIPAEFPGADNTGADIHITPDGRFVYASNRGHDSLAMFAVDPVTRALTSLGQVSTVQTPREFEVDPHGRFVFVAGQASGTLASYAIGDDGRLTQLAVVEAGTEPLWVRAVILPGEG